MSCSPARPHLNAGVMWSTELVLTLLAACAPKDTGAPAPGLGASGAVASAVAVAASAPPVGITTVRAQQKDLAVLVTATGAVTPMSSVDVRPQVTSVIARVHIREGQFVRRGEALFTLDSRADVANVARARAQMAKDEAGLADAQRQLTRSRELLAQNLVSQGAVDTNLALVESQRALAAADRAPLFSFATVKRSVGPTAIHHIGQSQAVTVSFNLAPGTALGDATAKIEKARQAIQMPSSVITSCGGDAAVFKSSQGR